MPLMRVDVLDTTFGVCLFEKIWKWSGVSRSDGLCKLVLTFHQISREIGDSGEVSQVLFEMPATTSIRDRGHSTGGSYLAPAQKYQNIYIGSLKNKAQKEKSTTIRLTTGKSDSIIVACFHDPTDQIQFVNDFIKNLVDEFTDMYGKKIPTMKKQLDEVANSDQQSLARSVLEEFKDFSSVVQSAEAKFSALTTPTTLIGSSSTSDDLPESYSDSPLHRLK